MELEDRVKALENELKILKNQIQSTLLDIEERVLAHYYPTLRAEEDSSPPEDILQSLESIRSERRNVAGKESAPSSRRGEEPSSAFGYPQGKSEDVLQSLVSLLSERRNVAAKETALSARQGEEAFSPEDILQSLASILLERSNEAPKEAPIFARAKETPLDVLGMLQGTSSSSKEQPRSRSREERKSPGVLRGQASPPSEEEDWAIWTGLVEWVRDSVERIGGERTGKLIERYAQEGHLSPEVKALLLQLISLNHRDNLPGKVEVKDMLDVLLELNEALGLKRKSDIAMALSLIKEQNLG